MNSGAYGGIASSPSENDSFSTIRNGTRKNSTSQASGTLLTAPRAKPRRAQPLLPNAPRRLHVLPMTGLDASQLR